MFVNNNIYKFTHTILYMPKKKGDEGEITLGTDAWNVADGYAKLKVLRQLIQLDRWEIIAQFGTEEVDEDNNFSQIQLKKRRVEALERYITTLRQLIGNTLFAIKSSDIQKMRNFLSKLELYSTYIPKLYRQMEGDNLNDDSFEINEKLFNNILKKLQNIKDEINTPLNNANLIFRASEEVDLDKIMNDIVQGG